MKRHDVCVRGEGPVGRCLALALSRQGLRVALQGRTGASGSAGSARPVHRAVDAGATPHTEASRTASDVRTYALNSGSVTLLQTLKVWDALPADARTAVHDMRIEGDDPQAVLHFSAYTQSVEALAWIVDAAELEAALGAAVRFAPHIDRVDHEVSADLLAIAEGRDAADRDRLGVQTESEAYGHVGVAARLQSDLPHGGLARQWFRSPEVLALLPFDRPQPGAGYGLVWSVPEARAERLLHLEPGDFERALAEATGGAAGALRLCSERVGWPLRRALSGPVCGPGWVLLGDAAHVVHPLAGQGLNLGLADVASLAQTLAGRESWRALGDEKLLRRHARRRHGPTLAMLTVTDGLWRLFAHDHPVVRSLRNRGMMWLDRAGPLKKALTARALHS